VDSVESGTPGASFANEEAEDIAGDDSGRDSSAGTSRIQVDPMAGSPWRRPRLVDNPPPNQPLCHPQSTSKPLCHPQSPDNKELQHPRSLVLVGR